MKPFYQLSDFPDRKNAGKNFIAECPKCGKKHLSIDKVTGKFYCFYAGCGFHGRLRDFWDQRPQGGSFFRAAVAGPGCQQAAETNRLKRRTMMPAPCPIPCR